MFDLSIRLFCAALARRGANAAVDYARHRLLNAVALVGILGSLSLNVSAADLSERCVGLKQLKRSATTIIEARLRPANADSIQIEYSPQPIRDLPEHCLLRGQIEARTGTDGVAYGSKFELRMPSNWSGRILFQGGGGLDGILRPALGTQGTQPTALARGYAVVSTDGGHAQESLRTPGTFAADERAFEDYAFRSTRVVMDAARAIIATYYGSPSKRAYFLGCSNGGREGMMAAQRYPDYFDGIVAGAPAFNLTNVMLTQAWNTIEFAAIAPKDSRNEPELHRALSDFDLKLLSNEIIRQCDAKDGARDELVSDPESCNFDPSVLACTDNQAEGCLSSSKVTALQRVFKGPRDSAGRELYATWPYDPGIGEPGWRAWMLGSEQQPAINLMIAPTSINDVALRGAKPSIDLLDFDFDRDPQRLTDAGRSLNATSTDYAGFARRRGKLLLYHGMADPVFSANDLIRYYKQVVAANGGLAATQQFARLFMVPGMNHCGGGRGLTEFDALGALEEWVEKGVAPQRIIASGRSFPGRTRPLCPHPAVARYSGSGDQQNAASFMCR